MKSLKESILEKLVISSTSKSKEQQLNFKGVEINNNADCKALNKRYINAVINAFMKSPLKKNVVQIDVTNAKSFFDDNEEGKNIFKRNQTNYAYLYCQEYPAISITYKVPDNKFPKYDTAMKRVPSIHMPLILTDDEGLFTCENSPNVTGYRDVEVAYISYNPKNAYRINPTYTFTIIYLLKPEATNKLLPVEDFESNLLKYYKMGEGEKRAYLNKISEDFYTDVRRNKYGALDISKERRDECEKHSKEGWD